MYLSISVLVLPNRILAPDTGAYTVILIHPGKPILFLGTSDGLVEVWNLSNFEKRAELRYLVVNEYGEQIPVEDPVVNLASSATFELVYAFMGNYAYCIDVELLVIIEKVPISEYVVSGNIGQVSGEIGVITRPGYLSRWSPKFVERRSHIDFNFKINNAYLLHDYDEYRMILVFDDGELLVANLKDEPYTMSLKYPATKYLLNGIWYDCNSSYQVMRQDDGNVLISDNTTEKLISPSHFLSEGKIKAEDRIRDFVRSNAREDQRDYITDFRLLRESKDRYVAEVEKLKEDSHYQASIAEDSKTLHFALEETMKDDLETKTTAYSVIEKLADRYEITPWYLFLARRMGSKPNDLIEVARGLEFKAYRRKTRIRNTIIISIILSILTLIMLDQYLTGNVSSRLYLIFVLLSIFVLLYWDQINQRPQIPDINDYRLIRGVMIIIQVIAIAIDIYYSFLSDYIR